MTDVIKNNFVSKESENFLLDPDNEVIYEWKITRVDTNSKNKRTMTKFHSSHAEFMEVAKKYGLKPRWQVWENFIGVDGKPTGKGKYKAVIEA